jgi:hypothetical protein
MWDNKKLAIARFGKEREQVMNYAKLRDLLNEIAESENKSSLDQTVEHMRDDGRYNVELMVSATTGKMVLIDEISTDDTEIEV